MDNILEVIIFRTADVGKAKIVQVDGKKFHEGDGSESLKFTDIMSAEHLVDVAEYLIAVVGIVQFQSCIALSIRRRNSGMVVGLTARMVCPVSSLVQYAFQCILKFTLKIFGFDSLRYDFGYLVTLFRAIPCSSD